MSLASAASYAWGQCTYYAAKMVEGIPGGLGNADQWVRNARARGIPVLSYPVAGSVVQWGDNVAGESGSVGHVAVVESVNPNGSFVVSEMNYKGVNVVDRRTVPNLNGVQGFIAPGAAGAEEQAAPPAESASYAGSSGLAGFIAGVAKWATGLAEGNLVPLVIAVVVGYLMLAPQWSGGPQGA